METKTHLKRFEIACPAGDSFSQSNLCLSNLSILRMRSVVIMVMIQRILLSMVMMVMMILVMIMMMMILMMIMIIRMIAILLLVLLLVLAFLVPSPGSRLKVNLE